MRQDALGWDYRARRWARDARSGGPHLDGSGRLCQARANEDPQLDDSLGQVPERINLHLRRHQISADWDLRSIARMLHAFAGHMNLEFKLEIPVPALSFPSVPNGLGRFQPGRNFAGLRGEVGLDKRHVQQDPQWHVLGTLLHFLLRNWQV